MEVFYISNEPLDLTTIKKILSNNVKIELSEKAKEKIINCRQYLDNKINNRNIPIYGVNTGFGALCNISISANNLATLQKNLVMSHACGTGNEVPVHIVKLMILLKIYSLAQGYSGIQLQTVLRLIDMYNNNIIPVVYEQGSLGASGDLSPLAHLSLPLIGYGEVNYNNKKFSTQEIYALFNWKPIELQSKEGLALLNGTQFMSAYGVATLIEAFKLSDLADIIGAISLEAFDGRIEPFHPLIQQIRPHKGQKITAERISNLLKDSEIIKQPKKHVQDPYSFRCIPQVHGASKDIIEYVKDVIECEINSVTDNPTIFPEEDLIISAGNFHGQPLAIALDSLSIALAELGNISERRTYQLLSGKRGLPPFLVKHPGLNSGFMIPQYTAASIVNQNKILCTPASVDSIETSQGQEDHVSMGANAAIKAYKISQNIKTILAIELFTAAQAIEFRRPLKTGYYLENFLSKYRKIVNFIENDEIMYKNINATIKFLDSVDNFF
jgi:histidine ammonia-lyase